MIQTSPDSSRSARELRRAAGESRTWRGAPASAVRVTKACPHQCERSDFAEWQRQTQVPRGHSWSHEEAGGLTRLRQGGRVPHPGRGTVEGPPAQGRLCFPEPPRLPDRCALTAPCSTAAPGCRTPVPPLGGADQVQKGHATSQATRLGGAGQGLVSSCRQTRWAVWVTTLPAPRRGRAGAVGGARDAQRPAVRSVHPSENQVPASFFSLHTWGRKSQMGPGSLGVGQRLSCD